MKPLIFKIDNYIKTLKVSIDFDLEKSLFFKNLNLTNSESGFLNSFENVISTFNLKIKKLEITTPPILINFGTQLDLNRFELLVKLSPMVFKSLYYLNHTFEVKITLYKFFYSYNNFKKKYPKYSSFGDFDSIRLDPFDLLIIIYDCSGDKAVTDLNRYYSSLIFILRESNNDL